MVNWVAAVAMHRAVADKRWWQHLWVASSTVGEAATNGDGGGHAVGWRTGEGECRTSTNTNRSKS